MRLTRNKSISVLIHTTAQRKQAKHLKRCWFFFFIVMKINTPPPPPLHNNRTYDRIFLHRQFAIHLKKKKIFTAFASTKKKKYKRHTCLSILDEHNLRVSYYKRVSCTDPSSLSNPIRQTIMRLFNTKISLNIDANPCALCPAGLQHLKIIGSVSTHFPC